MKIFSISGILSIAALFAVNAHADFSGHWTGKGNASDSQGWQSDCEMTEFDIQQTPINLIVNLGYIKCGSIESRWEPFSLEIRNGELFDHGNRVGTISGQQIHAEQNSTGMSEVFDLNLSGDSLNYQQVMTDGRDFLKINSLMSR